MATSSRKLAYGAWAAICVIWGTTYLAIKICLETIPPALMGGLRFMTAAGILIAALLSMSARLPDRKQWPALAVVGILLLGVGNGAVILAEQWVPSGITAVVAATMPLWAVMIESLIPGSERLRPRHAAGLALGFAGILLLAWPEVRPSRMADSRFLLGVGALQLGCIGWVLGSIYAKRQGITADPLAAAAMQMLFAGAFMLIVGTVGGEWSSLRFSARTLGALAYLVAAGSLIGFVAYIYALHHLPVSFVSLYAYINPIVAVALGTLLLSEPLTVRIVAAIGVIITGVSLVKVGEPKRIEV
jgi:drug/metabolite transporter (DMT)-like permease